MGKRQPNIKTYYSCCQWVRGEHPILQQFSFSDAVKLGGGCELALMCDIILAAPTAKFGQPEINLGVIPGGGGSQRLAHAIGKSRTMELVLTGRNFSAQEAEKWGVVSRVVGEGDGEVVREALELAKVIASRGRISVIAGKEAVNKGDFIKLESSVLLLTEVQHSNYRSRKGCMPNEDSSTHYSPQTTRKKVRNTYPSHLNLSLH